MVRRPAAMALASGALALGLVAFGQLRAERIPLPGARAAVEALEGVDGMSAVGLSESERREVQALAARRVVAGEGGGATVADIFLAQTEFLDSACPSGSCDEPCNVVFVAWTETVAKPGGIRVFVDGGLLGTLPGLPPAQIPGTNGVVIRNVPAGMRTFAIEAPDDGSTDSASMDVLASQPFGDAQGVQCRDGGADGTGTCSLVVTLKNPGPPPDSYGVFLDGLFLGELDGAGDNLTVEGVGPGSHCVMLIPVEDASSDAIYRGCVVESCCTLACARYVLGSCDGAVPPNLTTGVFGLNFLFLAGPQPPCLAACDTNGDGEFNVTDAAYLFNFLFLNGPAPPGWVDGQPACIPAERGDPCETPPAFCSTAG